MDKIYDFKTQLDIGKKGETILKNYLGMVPSLTDKYDFLINGTPCEVKTERYVLEDFSVIHSLEKINLKITQEYKFYFTHNDENRYTKNICFEAFSDYAKKTPGGPWQAKLNGAKKYISYIFYSGLVYEFDIDELINRLKTKVRSNELKKIRVKNKGYESLCYLMPVDGLLDIAKIRYIPLDYVKPFLKDSSKM